MTLGHSYDGTRERQRILVLNRMDAADVQQKTELTLACFSLDYNLRSQIVKFNQTSTDCRIVVRDYAEYADGEDYYAGLTVFNTEVLAGKIPDLIVGNMMLPIRQYAARGMMESSISCPSILASPRQSASAGSSAITRHGRWLTSRTRSASCPKARWYSTSITPSRRCSCIASP